MALSVAVCAALWPHAREAGAILAAQDDPAALSDIHVNSALRSNQALVADNIEAALAADDSDLANSFVELARDKGIFVSDELSKRVSDAVTDAASASHFAKRFTTGLVTGNADDVASLSARSPAISSCSATSGTWCARVSTLRRARMWTGW